METLIEKAARRLQEQGGRMTPQRRLMMELLEVYPGHPTAEELYLQLQDNNANIHLSTVYRTLRWLQDEGLISSRWFEEERRQERFDPNWPVDHHHFVCVSCQRVIEFIEPLILDGIQVQFESRFDARVESASLVLYGYCVDCQAVKSGEAMTDPPVQGDR